MEYTGFMLAYVRRLRGETHYIVQSCVKEIQDDILKTVRERWAKGLSVDGGEITDVMTGKGYANPAYKAIKFAKNPKAGGKVDLTLTGDLGDNLELIHIGGGRFEIISTDKKYTDIGKKYGFKEFQLSKGEIEHFTNKLESLILEKIKNK